MAQAALEHLGAGGGVRRGVGQDVREAALLAGLQEPDEAGADELLGGVAEDALDRRALVDDRGRSASSTVMRSLECWTSEPKRASLVRRCTSSVSAALSSASETSVASAARLLCSGPRDRLLAGDREQPVRLAADRERAAASVDAEVAGTRSSASALADRRRGVPTPRGRAARRGRGRDGPRRGELGVGDDDAVALGQAEPGGHVVSGERARGGQRRMADVRAAGGGDEVGARGAEDPLARDGALLLAHEAGHARHDEAEEEDRGDVDHEAVVALVDDLQQRHHRRDQRGAGEQHQAQRREARVAVRRGPLELAHRRVQRRRAPQQVEADPADVEPHLAVVGAREGDEAVGEVGGEQGDDARGEQVERRPARARVDGEPDRRGEQQDVADRVGDRDQLRDRRELRRRAATAGSARSTRSARGRA